VTGYGPRDPATVPHLNGEPMIGQAREGCNWRRTVYRDGVEVVADCGCATHIGEPANFPPAP
jgi:hypothetical protein